MYTYPYAYYQEDTVDRNLVREDRRRMMHRFSSLQFENIQAQLEVEIENLSYQIERSTTHNRGVRREKIERRRIESMHLGYRESTSHCRTSSSNVTFEIFSTFEQLTCLFF